MPHSSHEINLREPNGATLRAMRQLSNRTQVQLAQLLGVTDRHVGRWESGDAEIPLATWELLLRLWGARHPLDFMQAVEPTRSWDKQLDAERDTIEVGDVVELQPMVGPLLRATVTPDLAHERHAAPDTFEAQVTEFVGAGDVGEKYEGFRIGERVTFARANVIHLDQSVPRGGDNFGLQVRLDDALHIGLRNAGEMQFPGLATPPGNPVVGFILRPEKWLAIKAKLDAAQVRHVWRRLARGFPEVREHGAEWPTS
ncbi:helix-turn-helix transcriptional regulator [Burkholderia cenocepacia]|uniref:helix-turn-helix domain-containing protein n=1 Tax=Burkholderia cenocepacia TaxID=95486 RepID=UPI002AB6C331|nr:helix-turn-helix transcriptional regulator [Burkholderia cenocepacia]